MKFYTSKKQVTKLPKSGLLKDFLGFLKNTKKIYCPKLGRPVFLDFLPDALLERKDCKMRLECFFLE